MPVSLFRVRLQVQVRVHVRVWSVGCGLWVMECGCRCRCGGALTSSSLAAAKLPPGVTGTSVVVAVLGGGDGAVTRGCVLAVALSVGRRLKSWYLPPGPEHDC